MLDTSHCLETRLHAVERELRSTRRVAMVAVVGLLTLCAASWTSPSDLQDEVVTRRLVVLDEHGQQRVVIGSEGQESIRVAPYAGITIHDAKGNERGGLGVLDDGTAVLALDAPPGVGASMPDRIGMTVSADGAATLRMIDNKTMVPVRLVTDAAGQGGLEFLDYDLERREVHIKRLSYDGETTRTRSLGQ